MPQPDITPDEEPGVQRRAGRIREFAARSLRRLDRGLKRRRARRAAKASR
jgi:hypothetical protein